MKVKELLNLIPDEILEKIGKDVVVDKVNNKLTGKTIFKVLLFSLAETTRISLRTVERVYNSALFNQFAEKSISKSRHSSFSDRLRKINPAYFSSIFEHLVKTYHDRIPKNKQNYIYRFDATLIGLSSKLCSYGLKCGSKYKSHIKVVIGQKGLIPTSLYFCENNSEINDNIALGNAIASASVSKNDIIVFDRGIYDSKKFIHFSESGLTFVSRLQHNRSFKIIENMDINSVNDKKILNDQKILLHQKKKHYFSVPFRMIRIKSDQKKPDILLFTNNFSLTADEISEIYRRRWDIEVFFKFIKQELNMKHFLARNPNGIKSHIYMILIFSILLLIYKSSNNLTGFKFVKWDFFHELEMEVISDIISICGGDPKIFFKQHNSSESRASL